jgi:hypothetical protein
MQDVKDILYKSSPKRVFAPESSFNIITNKLHQDFRLELKRIIAGDDFTGFVGYPVKFQDRCPTSLI